MTRIAHIPRLALAAVLATLCGHAAAIGTDFTYQGHLTDAGEAAQGPYDLRFTLLDAPNGNPVGVPQTRDDVPVSGGVFTVSLDFGDTAFSGAERSLRIEVRRGAETGAYTMLAPSRAIAPTPYAQVATSAEFAATVADLAVSTTQLANGAVTRAKIASNAVGTAQIDAAQVQRRVTGVCAANTAMAQIAQDGSVTCVATGGGSDWSLTGNAGTTAGTNFLGTTDAVPLDIQVKNLRALRAQPSTNASVANPPPHLIGGADINAILPGTLGSVIAGGGGVAGTVDLTEDARNYIASNYSFIGAGWGNSIQGSTQASVVAGGFGNTINSAFVASNFIGSGEGNLVTGGGSVIGGGLGNAISGNHSVIGGGVSNEVSMLRSTIAGGSNNKASGPYSTVAGGLQNHASGEYGFVGGGFRNEASAPNSTASGGRNNRASGENSSVGGGLENRAQGYGNTVAGGFNNTANATMELPPGGNFVGSATVGGGRFNSATGIDASVAGGHHNSASATGATVSGGGNTLAGAGDATVAGGNTNAASGAAATVSGGSMNCAGGQRSWAGGSSAKVRPGTATQTHFACQDIATSSDSDGDEGTFIWADATTDNSSPVVSTGPNQFIVRASGGVWFGTTSTPALPIGRFINTSTGAYLSVGGTWTNSSDRHRTTDIEAVDSIDVLARVLTLPLTTWRYSADDRSLRHIGPMAQDFHAAFGLNGQDDTHIATVDADGVALAAIQGLNARLEADVSRLHHELAALREELAALRAGLAQPKRQ